MTISLADHAGAQRPDPVDQHAVDDPQQRAGQHRHRDHQALLRRDRDAGPAAICTASGPSSTQTMKLMSK